MAMKKAKIHPESTTPEATEPKPETSTESAIPRIEDPIGDVTDGEARAALEAEPEPKSDTEIEAQDNLESGLERSPEPEDAPRPSAKLERLQKILAAAGVASRRSAEALIEQGRVQVNGKVVTVLGTKADAGRDHIRVDGKLLQGAERLRYFVLNKPRGFVTTVKDPEGRPTVMQFFEKMKERLYPVGRLDYMSEGLLVVTNDGELANRLTKASSGVEKTYLVKVAGQPTEAELEILRGGVAIERGAPGSPKVHTSPARIRQVRQGDNPWYEVVLIEGRNRELRKMFEEIGHFVEKIRRTGYGPLVLDQEPGNLRELEPRELELLRQAADGTLRTPKAKEIRRRNAADAGLLPTVRPKPSSHPRPPTQPPAATDRPTSYRPKIADRPNRPARPYDKRGPDKPLRSDRAGAEGFRPAAGRTSAPNPVRSFSHSEDERPHRTGSGNHANFGSARPAGRSFDRSAYDRPNTGAPRSGSVGTGRTGTGRPFTSKPKFDRPAWKKPEHRERPGRPQQSDRPNGPSFQRPAPPRREAPKREPRVFGEELDPVRPPNLYIEEIKSDNRGPARPFQPRPSQARKFEPRPAAPRTGSPRPYSDRPRPNSPSRPTSPGRPSFEKPALSPRSGPTKPFRSEGGLARPFTTSSGKPRPGGARPSSKRDSFKSYGDKPAGRSSAGAAKRDSGSRYKGKPSGPKRSGPPSGGKRSGNKPGGKKRG
ncbi:MAG: pseudouridine synthase [Terracidiphilus sp.]|jgi:23S rRNA pseudouridine2605 synthase